LRARLCQYYLLLTTTTGVGFYRRQGWSAGHDLDGQACVAVVADRIGSFAARPDDRPTLRVKAEVG
jgi:hypothetical protein